MDEATILERGRAVMRAEAESISQAERLLDESFCEAVRLVRECTGRVCVTGVGKARVIGEKIQATLASTGTLSYNLHPVEALHGDLGMVHADDVVVALSKSGSSELVQVLPLLKKVGCRVILLTAKPKSAAAAHADVILEIGDVPEACPLGLAPSTSTASMLALGDALALAVMDQREVCADQYASYHPGGALGRSLMRAREIMRTGADCPRVPPTASLSECYEAIVKAPRRAGSVLVVDGDDRLLGIMTQGDFIRFLQHRGSVGDPEIHEVMNRDPKVVQAHDRVPDALELMRQYRVDELPVVGSEGQLLGLIDVQDLIASGFSVFDQP